VFNVLPGTGRLSRLVANEGLLILAALAAVYIVLGVLYEASFIHHDSFHSAIRRVGALLALIIFKQDLSVSQSSALFF